MIVYTPIPTGDQVYVNIEFDNGEGGFIIPVEVLENISTLQDDQEIESVNNA